MKNNLTALILSAICLFTSVSALSSCGPANRNVTNLMDEITTGSDHPSEEPATNYPLALTDEEIRTAIADFAVSLFSASYGKEENTLISPLSVLTALAMTANGADGITKTEFEALFGADIQNLNGYLSGYLKNLPSGDGYKLHPANSIWFTEDSRFTVNGDFLAKNAAYYNADIFTAPFDNTTKDAINDWISKNTDGMIKNMLDKIPEDAVMYLINALAFEGEWQNIYNKNQIHKGVFHPENGEEKKAEFMFSEERSYISDELADGFIKHYKDKKYAFAAMLPKEGVTISEYVKSLTGEKILELIDSAESTMVSVGIPKFEAEYNVEMSEVLKSMGLKSAFSSLTADLSKLGTSARGNLFISRVLHKTFIAVDERGTKAGAATIVEVADECAYVMAKEIKLDRPFIYMLIDCETGLPFFIGALTDIK